MRTITKNDLVKLFKKFNPKLSIKDLDYDSDFEIIIKTNRNDRESLSIKFEYVRVAIDLWELRFPKDTPKAIRGNAKSLSIELQECFKRAKNFILLHEDETAWRSVENYIQNYFSSGNTVYDLGLTRLAAIARTSAGYRAHIAAPTLTYGYFLAGKKAIDKNDLLEATYCADEAALFSSFDMMEASKNSLRKRATTGGIGKSKKFNVIRKIFHDQLSKFISRGDILKKSEVIQQISEYLRNNHLNELDQSGLQFENLERTLSDWLRKY